MIRVPSLAMKILRVGAVGALVALMAGRGAAQLYPVNGSAGHRPFSSRGLRIVVQLLNLD